MSDTRQTSSQPLNPFPSAQLETALLNLDSKLLGKIFKENKVDEDFIKKIKELIEKKCISEWGIINLDDNEVFTRFINTIKLLITHKIDIDLSVFNYANLFQKLIFTYPLEAHWLLSNMKKPVQFNVNITMSDLLNIQIDLFSPEKSKSIMNCLISKK